MLLFLFLVAFSSSVVDSACYSLLLFLQPIIPSLCCSFRLLFLRLLLLLLLLFLLVVVPFGVVPYAVVPSGWCSFYCCSFVFSCSFCYCSFGLLFLRPTIPSAIVPFGCYSFWCCSFYCCSFWLLLLLLLFLCLFVVPSSVFPSICLDFSQCLCFSHENYGSSYHHWNLSCVVPRCHDFSFEYPSFFGFLDGCGFLVALYILFLDVFLYSFCVVLCLALVYW